MKTSVQILNQIFEIQQKAETQNFAEAIERNLRRILSLLADDGLELHNPMGEKYTNTRTDVEANIVGKEAKNMFITEVIKPIIYTTQGERQLLQKGVVMVQAK
jgi:hypothetical protein